MVRDNLEHRRIGDRPGSLWIHSRSTDDEDEDQTEANAMEGSDGNTMASKGVMHRRSGDRPGGGFVHYRADDDEDPERTLEDVKAEFDRIANDPLDSDEVIAIQETRKNLNERMERVWTEMKSLQSQIDQADNRIKITEAKLEGKTNYPTPEDSEPTMGDLITSGKRGGTHPFTAPIAHIDRSDFILVEFKEGGAIVTDYKIWGEDPVKQKESESILSRVEIAIQNVDGKE